MIARFLLALGASAAAMVPSPALAWGRTGHRVIAAVADQHLSGLARAHVREILGVESLDEAAFWPDEMKSDPSPFWQKTASPWHYVTVGGFTYDQPPPEGDAQSALRKFRAMLEDPATSKADRQLALRFIVHLVGDLHQPLHVGRPGDRGGNDVKVTWFGRDTNLHAVWDTALVDDEQLSFTEWAERLNRHTRSRDVIDWWVVNPIVWITESAQIRETIYPRDPALSWDYGFRHKPVIKRRLAQGGVRLAAYLNDLFDPGRGARPDAP
ncbi:MAG: S1/P1 nuclease [Sphingomicrobium sp.]